jgi:hypothetical protein
MDPLCVRRGMVSSASMRRLRYYPCFTRQVKTAVSIPDRLCQSAEKLAARLGVSRSELYARALASLVEKHREDLVTAQLNDLYGPGGETSSLDQDVASLQSRSIRP